MKTSCSYPVSLSTHIVTYFLFCLASCTFPIPGSGMGIEQGDEGLGAKDMCSLLSTPQGAWGSNGCLKETDLESFLFHHDFTCSAIQIPWEHATGNDLGIYKNFKIHSHL